MIKNNNNKNNFEKYKKSNSYIIKIKIAKTINKIDDT